MTSPSLTDFRIHAVRTGSDDAGRVDFHRMLSALVGVTHLNATDVRPAPGDWGIDVLVGSLIDSIMIWQSKYFYTEIGDSQKRQIRESFKSAMTHAQSRSPRDAVLFVLGHLDDVRQAWELAHTLHLDGADVWEQLAKAYQKTDPAAVLPVYRRLVENELTATGARHYQAAARRLKIMRRLAAIDNDSAVEVDTFVADLREQHRRRPRLQREFDRAGLP